MNFKLPPPFTTHEFWKKIVSLLTETKGYVRHSDFERIFGVKMNEEHGVDNDFYRLNAGDNWHFDATILETKENFRGKPIGAPDGISSRLQMNWSVDAFGDWKKGQCILAGDAIQFLLDAGWTMKQKKVWNQYDRAMMGDLLTLGNSELYIKHYVHYLHGFNVDDDATCITEFTVRGTPE